MTRMWHGWNARTDDPRFESPGPCGTSERHSMSCAASGVAGDAVGMAWYGMVWYGMVLYSLRVSLGMERAPTSKCSVAGECDGCHAMVKAVATFGRDGGPWWYRSDSVVTGEGAPVCTSDSPPHRTLTPAWNRNLLRRVTRGIGTTSPSEADRLLGVFRRDAHVTV